LKCRFPLASSSEIRSKILEKKKQYHFKNLEETANINKLTHEAANDALGKIRNYYKQKRFG
jgi:hypothetical protein